MMQANLFTALRTVFQPIWLAAALAVISTPALAQSHSDLLLIVHEDGTSYTAQQTLIADDELMVLELPEDRLTLQTTFAGPGSALHRRSNTQEPDKFAIASGSVFTRFHHRLGPDAIQTSPADTATSTADSEPGVLVRANFEQFSLTMGDADALIYRVSWLLPHNANLVRSGTDERTENNPSTQWVEGSRLVSFETTGRIPTQLFIEYELIDSRAPLDTAQACVDSLGPSEWCSPDTDNDGVPDYRDVCVASGDSPLNTGIAEPNVLSDQTVSNDINTVQTQAGNRDSLGCDDETRIVLSQVNFASGKTYLSVAARSELDKVAIALQRMPEKRVLIAAHTDNAGYAQNNQTLSDNRAKAIRHYLMLRGVGPNQVQAQGFGESQPAHDNQTAAGRQANRRIELQILD